MFYQGGEASIELKGDDVLDAEIIIKATFQENHLKVSGCYQVEKKQ